MTNRRSTKDLHREGQVQLVILIKTPATLASISAFLTDVLPVLWTLCVTSNWQ